MPVFTLHRNFVLRTTKGRSIAFEKGVPTHVPDILVDDAIGIGAVPAEGIENLQPEDKPAAAPLTPTQRKEAVFAAFRTMSARKERIDFTASGVPNAKRIPALTGFELTTAERDEYWMEFRAGLQEEQDQHNLDAQFANAGG